MAEMYYMRIAPHTMGSPIAVLAGAHVCATIPNFLAFEYHSLNIPLWSNMLDRKNPIQDGYMAAPDGPGLGTVLDEEAVLRELPDGSPLWL